MNKYQRYDGNNTRNYNLCVALQELSDMSRLQ